MQCICEQGAFLDEKQGTFVNDDGETIEYHTARFMLISEDSKIVKTRVPDGVKLPAPLERVKLFFDVDAGERYCRLSYSSFVK